MKFLSLIVAAATFASADDPKLQFDEFSAKMAMELGHIVNGENRDAGRAPSSLNFMPLYRNIVSLEQSGSLGESWTFDAGLKGILWWPFSTDQTVPVTRTVRIEPRPSVVKARYSFTTEKDKSFLEFGYFPYKYNRDAVNLGEYLYRSGTYPGIIFNSDGLQLMDHSYFEAYGAHVHLSTLNGIVDHEFNLFTEMTSYPIGDLTPAYEVSVHVPRFELGAGVAYNRGISFAPSKIVSNDPVNQYIQVQAHSGATPDSIWPAFIGPYKDTADPVVANPNIPYAILHKWTQRGVKLMGRAAVDLGFLLPDELRGPNDLRVFTEVALLGWANQPYYYEDRFQRMPIMVGVNIPTLRYLDLFAVQVEYYASPFNGMKDFNDASIPVWSVQNYETKDRNYFSPSNWKWSIDASKSVNRLLKVKAQIANDHLRPRLLDAFSYTDFDLTQGPKNWYYLVQMEVGL